MCISLFYIYLVSGKRVHVLRTRVKLLYITYFVLLPRPLLCRIHSGHASNHNNFVLFFMWRLLHEWEIYIYIYSRTRCYYNRYMGRCHAIIFTINRQTCTKRTKKNKKNLLKIINKIQLELWSNKVFCVEFAAVLSVHTFEIGTTYIANTCIATYIMV